MALLSCDLGLLVFICVVFSSCGCSGPTCDFTASWWRGSNSEREMMIAPMMDMMIPPCMMRFLVIVCVVGDRAFGACSNESDNELMSA